MADIFNSHKVITEHIGEADFRTYFVGFDLNAATGEREYRWKDLVNLLQAAIPEFAFGLHEGDVPQEELTHRLAEAAKSIYKIDSFKRVSQMKELPDDHVEKEYLTRGEFGELVLHLLLRSYHDTIPLISKIYFKDSHGMTVHGFDAVHVQPNHKTLWLGESKLYKSGESGLKALVKDLKEHIKEDYLEAEFSLISKKLKVDTSIPDRQHWLDLLHEKNKLSDALDSITIPLLCTYTSSNFTSFDDETIDEFIAAYEAEVRELKDYFHKNNDHPLKSNLNIVLMLFPVQSKDELVRKLHKKLKLLQSIEDA